jgi:aspartate/methionine/tyrosine aminotransferase
LSINCFAKHFGVFIAQVAMSCLVNPPKPGSPSYEQHKQERETELASLRRRARMVTDGFNSLEDVTCNFTEGAMYSFPQLRLPAKAIAAAKAAGKAPDVFYCLRLLEETGALHGWLVYTRIGSFSLAGRSVSAAGSTAVAGVA